jgi:hypothetical protein
VVGSLRTDLADATRTFKDLLQQRSTNVKAQFDRRGQYGLPTSDALALGEEAEGGDCRDDWRMFGGRGGRDDGGP